MNANRFLADLRADPTGFLRHHVFFVAGLPSSIEPVIETLERIGPEARMLMPTRSVPPSRGRFVIQPDSTRFTGFQTGRAGRRNETKQRDKLILRPAGSTSPAAQVLDAWFVPMTDQAQHSLTSYVVLPGNDGPDVALTPQMSGCTFGIGSAARDGTRIMSHTRPGSGGTAGKERFGPMADVFDRTSRPGANFYGNIENRATIIGLRTGHQWSFFVQTYRTNPNELLSVEQLRG